MHELCDVLICRKPATEDGLFNGRLCPTHSDALQKALKEGTIMDPDLFAAAPDSAEGDLLAASESYALWLARQK